MSEVTTTVVQSRAERREFIRFPKDLYAGCAQWVPPMDVDMRSFLTQKHPYFENAPSVFFLFHRGDTVVGRAAAMENRRYNAEHSVNTAHFYFVDFTDDSDVPPTLFNSMAQWARDRGLESLTGPLFSGGTMGGGVLIHGFEHRAAMTMMPYNFPYYEQHYVGAGFKKKFDLFSLQAEPSAVRLPDRVELLADKVRSRGRFTVEPLRNRGELKRVADEIERLYNPTLADHSENYPLTERELATLKKDLLTIARPDLETVIRYDGEVVGFILAFPDLSETLQRNQGKLGPIAIARLLRARSNNTKILFNGMGILEKHQRLGGNALLYSELAKSVSAGGGFQDCEMVQINEETEMMLRDMETLGAVPFKRHRVYTLGWS